MGDAALVYCELNARSGICSQESVGFEAGLVIPLRRARICCTIPRSWSANGPGPTVAPWTSNSPQWFDARNRSE